MSNYNKILYIGIPISAILACVFFFVCTKTELVFPKSKNKSPKYKLIISLSTNIFLVLSVVCMYIHYKFSSDDNESDYDSSIE